MGSKIEMLIKEYCPDGVEYKTLGDIGSFYGGLTGKSKEDFKDGNAHFITYMNVFNNPALDITTNDRVKLKEGEKQNEVQLGDILFTGSSESKEEAGFASVLTTNTDEKLYLNSFCFGYRFYDRILLPDFCKHLFRSSMLRKQIIKTASGVTRFNISKKKMLNVRIPVPPLEVQREIIRILDHFTLLSAELSAELKARKLQYEYYRDELIDSVPGKKGKLIEFLSQPITDGPHTTPVFFNEGIPFISAKAVYDGRIHLELAQGYISHEFDAECAKKYKPQKNDVYMVKSGSTTGKVAFVDTDDDFNIWSPIAAMRADSITTARYIYHLLQTSNVQSQVQIKASHGSQPNLSMRALEQFDVVIPTIQEQARIVNLLDRLDEICSDIYTGLPAEIEARQKQYEYCRDKLLTFKEKIQ